MADIHHDFLIHGPAARVYEAITSPQGLDSWWTLRAAGEPVRNSTYEFNFGENYNWQAIVLEVVPGFEISWEFTEADADWTGTTLKITMREDNGDTSVRFEHTGWPEPNEHFRITTFCWAMYLRLLKRYVEHGEVVPYEDRLEV